MESTTHEFPYFSNRHWLMKAGGAFCILMCLFSLALSIISEELWLILLATLVFIAMVWLNLYLFRTKIVLNEKGIKYVGPLKSYFIYWRDVMQIGYLRSSKYSTEVISEEEAMQQGENSVWKPYNLMIYVSTIENFKPHSFSLINSKYINVFYKPEIKQLIYAYLKGQVLPSA